MIYFKCCHCDKEIHGVTIMFDKTHFLHEDCEKEFRLKKLIDKWKDSGILDGLTVMNKERSNKLENLIN